MASDCTDTLKCLEADAKDLNMYRKKENHWEVVQRFDVIPKGSEKNDFPKLCSYDKVCLNADNYWMDGEASQYISFFGDFMFTIRLKLHVHDPTLIQDAIYSLWG